MTTPKCRSLVVASIAVALAASPAFAGGAPALEVKWTLDGNVVLTELPAGDPAGSGFRYNGGGSFGSVDMTYSLFGDPDPIVSGSFAVENLSNATVEVELQVTLPILPSLPDFTVMTGSVAVSMTADLDGGELAALPGIPFWQGMIDGSPVGGATDLLSGLLMVSSGPGSPPGESGGFIDIDGPAALDSIGIRITFSLTPGEQMSFTSVFSVVVPGPAGLAFLALGAVWTRRRRRTR